MAKTRLAEIYEMEKARGGGLASTLGKRALEKIDPRQIFNQEGLLAAAFPSLFKAYRVKSDKTGVKSGSKISESGFNSLSIEGKLDSLISDSQVIRANSNLIAKSALVLPKIHHDTNLTRQNIARLVKLLGGKPTYKPDMFFKGALEREKEYESKYGKEKAKVGKEKEKEDSDSKLKRESANSLLGLITASRDATTSLGLLKTALAPLVGPAGLLFGLGAAALYAMNKMSDKLKERAREEGGEEAVALEEKVQGETLLGAMDPMGTSFVTGESVTGEKLTSTDDQLAQRRKYQAEEGAKKWRDWSMKSQAWRGAAERSREVTPSPVAAGAIVEPPTTPEFAGETAGWKKYGMGPDVAAMKHDQIGAISPTPAGIGAAIPKTPSKMSGSIPSDSSMGIDYAAYAEIIGKKESGGDYKTVNSIGYLGKYQFGAMALEDMGLVKKGVGKKGQKALDNPDNWNLPGGKQAFLSNPQLQEDTMLRYTKQNFASLNKMGVITKSSSPQDISGYLASSHLLGTGGARDLSQGKVGKDAYGTSSSSYFKIGAASQAAGGGTLASASTGSAPSSGAKVAAATQGVAVAGQQVASAPTIINNTNNNVKGGEKTPRTASASTYDKEMMGTLVGRAA